MAGRYAAPWVRVSLLIAGVVVASLYSYLTLGHLIPKSNTGALLYQNGLLLLVLGSSIEEHQMTKPADSLVNSLGGLITLLPVYSVAPKIAWFFVFAYVFSVFVASAICVAVSDSPLITGWKSKLAKPTYRLATLFGQARILFSVVLLFGVFSFYSIQSPRIVVFLCFWALYLSIWPLQLPQLLSTISFRSDRDLLIAGSMVRFDWPNIVRVKVSTGIGWSHNKPKLCRLSDGACGMVLPLYFEQQPDHVIGVGIFVERPITIEHPLSSGLVYELPSVQQADGERLAESLGATPDSPMIGFVVEESEIGQIRFETWSQGVCKEGDLIWVKIGDTRVYYQVVNGINREETFDSNRHGFQIAVAAQVGEANPTTGFEKYPWLPSMNSPVFSVDSKFGESMFSSGPADMLLGLVPNSRIPIHLSLDKALDHHMAILGLTGTGKTELAFDIIRRATEMGIKVICVDLTGRYEERLAGMTPTRLSIDPDVAKELTEKLFDVEVGKNYAIEEKKVLRNFKTELRKSVYKILKAFLEGNDDRSRVGIITLPDISNTKATLFITELYMSLILGHAKKYAESPRILLVLEEAHTVIPEATTMGLGDFESKSLVGKMAQIALQGRKYRVGLIVLAQRTATVSKTVLTQCNTTISFACIDDTSLGFLSNVFGSSHVALIPNLMPLQAVVFGKAIRSQRPIVVEIPFDEAKVHADDRTLETGKPAAIAAKPSPNPGR
jgi:uncharacterized protein